MLQILKY